MVRDIIEGVKDNEQRKRKRKRDLTRPETLNIADEKRFEREELVAEMLADKDMEWKET